MEVSNALNKLQKEFNENVNSHVFLVETNNTEQCLNDIKEIISNKIQASETTRKQILEENYLELIIVRPDGKDIKRDQIALLQERLKTKPVLSEYLFYVIVNSEVMNDTATNKLLKTIEEPSDNIIGFLITKNIDLIIPTLKSRCEQIDIRYSNNLSNNKIIDNEILQISGSLVMAIENDDLLEFNKLKLDNTIIKDNGKEVANCIKNYYNTACLVETCTHLDDKIINFIKENNSINLLVKKAKYLNKTLNKLVQNMNSDLLLEKIFIELKEVKGNASIGN